MLQLRGTSRARPPLTRLDAFGEATFLSMKKRPVGSSFTPALARSDHKTTTYPTGHFSVTFLNKKKNKGSPSQVYPTMHALRAERGSHVSKQKSKSVLSGVSFHTCMHMLSIHSAATVAGGQGNVPVDHQLRHAAAEAAAPPSHLRQAPARAAPGGASSEDMSPRSRSTWWAWPSSRRTLAQNWSQKLAFTPSSFSHLSFHPGMHMLSIHSAATVAGGQGNVPVGHQLRPCRPRRQPHLRATCASSRHGSAMAAPGVQGQRT